MNVIEFRINSSPFLSWLLSPINLTEPSACIVCVCLFVRVRRENKYIPPGQRNREAMSWGPGRQNSPRLAQSSAGPSAPRPGPHDYSPSSGADQRVVNGGTFNLWHTNLVTCPARYRQNTSESTEAHWLVSELVSILTQLWRENFYCLTDVKPVVVQSLCDVHICCCC